MNELEEGLIHGARLKDLFNPRRLFVGLAVRPQFVLPMLLLCMSAVIYGQAAVGPSLAKVIPPLLENSIATESELARSYRWMVLVLSSLLPILFLFLTSLAVWLLQLVLRGGQAFFMVLSLVSFASLWTALGFLVKAALVLLTGEAEPAANLSLLLDHPSGPLRLALAFTNPFMLLAALWTVIGLRMWGSGRFSSVFGGGAPWMFWIVFLTLGAGGTSGKLSPSGPVSYEGWEEIRKEHIVLRHPGKFGAEAEELATILDGFTTKLSEQMGFDPQPIRIHAFASHQDLERATGDFLHVKVTGSIRGRDLLFLEIPGRSVALPKVDGLYEAVRYVALMHLPFVPGIEGSPRWFVEGMAHAAARPYSDKLEQEYRSLVRRRGIPDFDQLLDPQIYRTPEGPIMARSVLDHIVFHHGREALAGIREDMKNGSTFRDALFSRTRLTMSALESGWQDSIRGVLEEEGADPTPEPENAVPDSIAGPDTVDVSPFLPRR